MWWLNWEDGGSLYADIGPTSNIAVLPNNTYAYAPSCIVPTASPTPSSTPSNTPSSTSTPTNTMTQTATPSKTATSTQTSLYSSGCPSAFLNSHYVNVSSITMANDTTAYMRHCGFWWFNLANFPVTSLVNVQDATCVVRLAADGSPYPAKTLQSVNYPANYLMVTPSGYMQYTAYAAASTSQLVNMSFNFVNSIPAVVVAE